MLFLRRSLVCLVMTAAIGSTGCAQVLGVALAAAFSALPRGGSHSPEVNRPVDRMMTVCELERGRWREENQEEDEDAMPRHLRCTPDGAYPFLPPTTAPARTATQAPVPAATPARPEAPAPGPAETPAPADAI